MGEIASKLAFPYPDKEWSQAHLLERERFNQLVFLTTESGHRYAFGDEIVLIYLVWVNNSKEDGTMSFLIFSFCRTFLRIPAVHIRSEERKFTIIYSHGNAEDVGLSLPYLDRLSRCCNCNVLAYEYCGYSIAEGEPSEKNCYECIDAAYRYLTVRRQSVVDPSSIVLFGRSLGTGPTVDLAARLLSETTGKGSSLAGVVLQSPLVR